MYKRTFFNGFKVTIKLYGNHPEEKLEVEKLSLKYLLYQLGRATIGLLRTKHFRQLRAYRDRDYVSLP